MKRRIAIPTIAATLGLLLLSRWAAGAPAGDPLSPFAVDPVPTHSETLPVLALDGAGNLLVAWSAYGDGDSNLLSRLFDPAAEPLAGPLAVANEMSPLAITPDRDGFTLLSARDFGHGIVYTQRLDRKGAPVGGPLQIAMDLQRLATDGGHRILAVGLRYRVPTGVFAVPLDPAGRPAGKPFMIAQGGGFPDVTMDAGGRFVVIWTDSQGAFGQRYSAAEAPLGVRFKLPSYLLNPFVSPPRIAGNAEGRFVVVWPVESQLFARLFAADGEPRGPVLEVTDGNSTPPFNSQLAVAMDASGAFLVTWDTFVDAGTQVIGRFYDPAGKPAGPPFFITAPAFYADTVAALAASAGATGQFAVAGQFSASTSLGTVFARRLEWAPAGDALCLYGAGGLACDLRRDGGAAEVSYSFGGQPGDVPLLGDLDGDGRDEPCVYRAGSFLCDSAHDGGAAELRIAFGEPGDVPLLGDLDGDGRDDPCVRRGDRFLCDTAHNGGTAEVVVTFGRAGDPALLGDVNGDGAADPCVIEGETLLCDTAHDGGTAETVLPFDVRPGDVPLLGDVDGDGRADPCVYRAGRLLCDTAHDGKLRLLLTFVGKPGAVPLLGNLEGL
jgi:hypothetical protein